MDQINKKEVSREEYLQQVGDAYASVVSGLNQVEDADYLKNNTEELVERRLEENN